jgi:hypothetical protein
MQVVRGLAPMVVVLGFLAVGMALTVLIYDLTGSDALAVATVGASLVAAATFTQRIVVMVLEYFS